MKSDTQTSERNLGESALILVDIQNDFLPGGALAVPDGDAIIAVANRLQGEFGQVIVTQDWHPANHGSFASNHVGRVPGDIIRLSGVEQVLWPDHCVQNTPGADLAHALETKDHWHHVWKGQHVDVDSYSGFFDNQRRYSTGLNEHLEECSIRRVYVMGLATDYCVKSTALDAVRLGFDTFVIDDGCRGVDLRPGDVKRAFDEMRNAGVQVVGSNSLQRHTCSESAAAQAEEILVKTPHVELVRRGTWDYVRRNNAHAVVAMIAVTSDDELVLIEQYRIPVAQKVIELPAGLAGDIAGAEDESLEQAASRELLEETGFQASSLIQVFDGPSSAGLTDETIHFFLASGLHPVHDGGGDETEEILVHRVPLADVDAWLATKQAEGCLIDAKLPTGLYLLGKREEVPFLRRDAQGG